MSEKKKAKKRHTSKTDVPAKKDPWRRHWRTDPYGQKVRNMVKYGPAQVR